ncbi:MAG: hypothetical protein HUK20_02840 [Fibrobacter sp.]|nr:hypothetical protein [Fibrobacter sp.]
MKNVLAVILFTFIGIGFCDSLGTRNAIEIVRQNIYRKLAANDSTNVDAMIRWIEKHSEEEAGIDNLEKIQIYLLQKRYEEAIALWGREYAKEDQEVRCTDFNDSLKWYLKKNMNLADYSGDTNNVYIQLRKAIGSNSGKETRDIARLLLLLKPHYHISDYIFISPNRPDSAYQRRFLDGFYYREFLNPQVYLDLADTLKKFASAYPNSEFTPWALKKAEKLRDFHRGYVGFLDYHKNKIYTGGYGVEAFISKNDGGIIAFPIQYGRFILTPLIGEESSGSDETLRHWEGFLFTFGFDLFDSKYFKVQPFVGAYDPYVAGAQVDFRFLQEKGVDPKLGLAGYLSLKIRYSFTWGELYSESSKMTYMHGIMIGIGAHFW